MTVYPCIYIVIVNYNNWPDTLECLESIFLNRYPSYRVVLVDNCSTDQSIFHIRQWAEGNLEIWIPPHHPLRNLTASTSKKPVIYEEILSGEAIEKQEQAPFPEYSAALTIIKNDHNGGFAAGNNLGLRFSLKKGGKYFLLLNNDTVVSPDFLFPMIDTMTENNLIGMVGGKIMYYQQPSIIWAAGGGNIRTLTSGMHHIGVNQPDGSRFSRSFDCDYITGCLLMTKSDLIQKIGLMDENYFLYYEETDWNLKAKKAGYRRVFAPATLIYHKASVSLTGQSLLMTYYYTRNRIYLVIRNYGIFLRLLTVSYLVLLNLLRSMFHLIKANPVKSRTILLACWNGIRRKMGRFEL